MSGFRDRTSEEVAAAIVSDRRKNTLGGSLVTVAWILPCAILVVLLLGVGVATLLALSVLVPPAGLLWNILVRPFGRLDKEIRFDGTSIRGESGDGRQWVVRLDSVFQAKLITRWDWLELLDCNGVRIRNVPWECVCEQASLVRALQERHCLTIDSRKRVWKWER